MVDTPSDTVTAGPATAGTAGAGTTKVASAPPMPPRTPNARPNGKGKGVRQAPRQSSGKAPRVRQVGNAEVVLVRTKDNWHSPAMAEAEAKATMAGYPGEYEILQPAPPTPGLA